MIVISLNLFTCYNWLFLPQEMIQLLKSVFRMDADQSARRLAREVFNHDDPDYYDFEGRQRLIWFP